MKCTCCVLFCHILSCAVYDPCRHSPCLFKSTCTRLKHGFRCTCQKDYYGKLCDGKYLSASHTQCVVMLCYNVTLHNGSLIGRVSLARENEAGAVGGRKSILSMLTHRTLFAFWL